ncbi:VOC family protein [Shewanella psychropiezotolerans]|uniref:VOC family protein n=1 Tax=Shewanella psychropiezotolerans TaxID=2593655 RepID=A0ABX5WXE8_9GAMM|nr:MULTISPECIES: VOC family protein [Shewanella]MPY26572.1 VOC family protein [Shewanella sp. YLB-07]QDO83765.1 VOC family protein [Shewanella psychropiezotolerans]
MTNAISEQVLIDTWPIFCDRITTFLQELGLKQLKLACDHTALRVNTVEAAEALSVYFQRQGKVISNNIINGRPILIFELNTPLIMGQMKIDCVELPYPGNKQYPIEGWEHIELVLACTATTCDELKQQLLDMAPQLAPVLSGQSAIKVKMSSPQGEHERLANPTIAFKKDDICIKIHPHGIKAVIESERQ